MFNFHTLTILVWCLTLMLSSRPTHGLLEEQSNHTVSNHSLHGHHHRHHYPRQQQHSHYHHTTPRIVEEESTTNTPLSLMDDNAITNKEDDELQFSRDITSWSSSTSTPARHHHNHRRHHMPQQLNKHPSQNGHLILTSASLSSPTSAASTSSKSSSFSNFILEQQQHHHHNHHQPQPQESSSPTTKRLVPTPLPPLPSYFLSATTQKYNRPANNGDGGGNQRRLSSSKAAEVASPAERSKFSTHKAGSLERDNYNRLHHHHHHQKHLQAQTKHLTMKRDYDEDDLQGRNTRTQQDDGDYYDEDDNEEVDNEEEDDIDGFIDDTDNNLSDRSYARITRSKLDDDYVDDEPYRNAVDDDDDNEMQRDAPGVLTDQKYLEVGNEKAVQQARERYIQEQKRPRTPHELATEHWQRMIHATKCRKPMPRVIPISNNTSKRYEPYATILHRCGDDTGCCGSTASVCTVKRQEIVMVYVFSYDFNYRKEIEALPMQNHTECHCVNRASLQYESMPRGKRSGSWQHHHLRSQQSHQLHYCLDQI
ncbi:uncharacterized protein LOC133333312 [Musca vetustissima]|uniref:uncharacterized protein LOC133333312 n=1 Tax=Musca vetustissima TaxID=27455 RepID=UPI002AB5FF03|nr:uncharacterized protein LOC133333312 [Musca vetustissima]